jgi:DNA-binding NtrC family response regulator
MREQMQHLVAELVIREIPLEVAIKEFEASFLREAISKNGGNISVTARQLGMHRNTLSRKIGQRPLRVPCHNKSSRDSKLGPLVGKNSSQAQKEVS